MIVKSHHHKILDLIKIKFNQINTPPKRRVEKKPCYPLKSQLTTDHIFEIDRAK